MGGVVHIFRASLLPLARACFLAGMGAFMIMLSVSPMYWRFLNPKYAWLSLGTGVAIALVGVGSLCIPQTARRSWGVVAGELAAVGVFLGLALTAVTVPNPFSIPVPSVASEDGFIQDAGTFVLHDAPPPATFSGAEPAVREAHSARLLLADGEYVRINIAELLAAEGTDSVSAGQRYVVRGGVVRTPELDAAGYIGVGRLLITCCFADAAGVAYLVRVENPQAWPHGGWVETAGILRPRDAKSPASVPVRGALSAIISDKYVLEAQKVESGHMPDIPFIFSVHRAEPYAF